MALNLARVKKNEIGIVVLPSSTYKKKEIEVVKYLSHKSNATCYVNINSQFNSLVKELENNKIAVKKFLFIDAVTKKSGQEHKNCIYLESIHALTGLSVTIKKSLETGKFDFFLFDSLSSLHTYHNVDTLTKFIHDLFAVIKKSNVVGIFTMQAGTNKDLMADISMFADHVIEVN